MPAPNTRWQLQLADLPVDTSYDVPVYDIDLFDNDAGLIAALHRQGRRAICYLNAGAWEDWRPDAGAFPPSVIGKDYSGWPGEKWLDIRRLDLLGPILGRRLDLCREKGFDGVDPDNVNGYQNDTGFPLTYDDQLTFNRWLATWAHDRNLSIGLKNDIEQTNELLPVFDWVLTEDCFAQGWCDLTAPFAAAGKAVLIVEYTDQGVTTDELCPVARRLSGSGILKHRELDAWLEACPP